MSGAVNLSVGTAEASCSGRRLGGYGVILRTRDVSLEIQYVLYSGPGKYTLPIQATSSLPTAPVRLKVGSQTYQGTDGAVTVDKGELTGSIDVSLTDFTENGRIHLAGTWRCG